MRSNLIIKISCKKHYIAFISANDNILSPLIDFEYLQVTTFECYNWANSLDKSTQFAFVFRWISCRGKAIR